MRLRKPCEHGRYELVVSFYPKTPNLKNRLLKLWRTTNGGIFRVSDREMKAFRSDAKAVLALLTDALADQVGEPG